MWLSVQYMYYSAGERPRYTGKLPKSNTQLPTGDTDGIALTFPGSTIVQGDLSSRIFHDYRTTPFSYHLGPQKQTLSAMLIGCKALCIYVHAYSDT